MFGNNATGRAAAGRPAAARGSTRTGKRCASAIFTPAVTGLLLFGTVAPVPASAELAPWAPPPKNACGETGFDPLARQPDPNAPAPPILPPRIDIPVPVPEIVPVPVPGPRPDNTRIVPQPLPADPCRNPCPDIRDTPKPPPAEDPSAPGEPAPDSGSASGSNGGSNNGSGTGSGSGSGTGSGSNSGPFNLPNININPEPEPIPIPIPGGEPPAPETPPHPVHPSIDPGAVVEAPAPRTVENVKLVNQVTGHGSVNRTDMRWQVDGTDLGIMWETKPGQVAVVFGDTFGKGWEYGQAGGPDWRSNVLGFSSERDLSKGLIIDDMVQDSRCHAAELLNSRKIKNFETTVIPTSGFALGDRQYMSYMSVNHWSKIPGMWWTNNGGLAYSDNGGSTWVKDQYAKWDNMFGIDRFQVTTMVPHGDYVYMFGTPNGRIGMIGLARVPKKEVLNKSAYQYWVDGTWAPAQENRATPLIPGIAGELSVRYDESSKQWQMVYLDPARHAIVLRTATEPQGTWTDGTLLADTNDYPKAYGGFIHPWSTGKDLYFTMSAWDSYNVYLMHATLNDPEAADP